MSKFTWPTRIVVEAEVIRQVDQTQPLPSPTHPHLNWGSLFVGGENRLIVARVLKVIEVEDQWQLHPPEYYAGDEAYVSVPQSEIRPGCHLKIELNYEPDMQPQTGPVIVGQIVRPSFLGWLDAE